jgi:hypothetical protein
MRNVKRGEGLRTFGILAKAIVASCPIDGILSWIRGTLWHFAPRAARETYRIIRRCAGRRKGPGEPRRSGHKRKARLSRQAEARGGSAGRQQCGLQRLLKNARTEQKQQHQQREMIKQQRAGGGTFGSVSIGLDWREPRRGSSVHFLARVLLPRPAGILVLDGWLP